MNDRAGKSRLRRAAGVTKGTSCPSASRALRNRGNLRRGETRCACAMKDTSCPPASRAFIGRGKLLAWRDTTAEREKCPLASSAPRNRANLRRDETRCACAVKNTSCGKNLKKGLDKTILDAYNRDKFNCKTVEREIKPVTDSQRACGGGIQVVSGPDKWTLEVCAERHCRVYADACSRYRAGLC